MPILSHFSSIKISNSCSMKMISIVDIAEGDFAIFVSISRLSENYRRPHYNQLYFKLIFCQQLTDCMMFFSLLSHAHLQKCKAMAKVAANSQLLILILWSNVYILAEKEGIFVLFNHSKIFSISMHGPKIVYGPKQPEYLKSSLKTIQPGTPEDECQDLILRCLK